MTTPPAPPKPRRTPARCAALVVLAAALTPGADLAAAEPASAPVSAPSPPAAEFSPPIVGPVWVPHTPAGRSRSTYRIRPRILSLPFDFEGIPGGAVTFRDLTWRGWGTERAVARGRLVLCNPDYRPRCVTQTGRVILDLPTPGGCPGQRTRTVYSAARAVGFPIIGRYSTWTVVCRDARSSAAGRQLGPARIVYPRGGIYNGFDPGTGTWFPSGNTTLAVRPRRISTGNEERIVVTGIRWRGWGSPVAVGIGRARRCYNAGCDAPYRGQVRLSRLIKSYCERTPNFYRLYTSVRMQLPDGSPGRPVRISTGIYC